MNHKRLYRLYREEKLMVRRRGGRKRALGSAPLALPQGMAVKHPTRRGSAQGTDVNPSTGPSGMKMVASYGHRRKKLGSEFRL